MSEKNTQIANRKSHSVSQLLNLKQKQKQKSRASPAMEKNAQKCRKNCENWGNNKEQKEIVPKKKTKKMRKNVKKHALWKILKRCAKNVPKKKRNHPPPSVVQKQAHQRREKISLVQEELIAAVQNIPHCNQQLIVIACRHRDRFYIPKRSVFATVLLW